MTEIETIIKGFNKSFIEIKEQYGNDYKYLLEEEKDWLDDLDKKTSLLTDSNDKLIIDEVILKLRDSNYNFTNSDTTQLSKFTSIIDRIVNVANRINNFKEGTILTNGKKLKLFDLFNKIKNSNAYRDMKIELNPNLNNFLPHIFSIVKHAQNPSEYPIYYKYWKNIIREVFSKEDDYDNLCDFYRELPPEKRHLTFGCYLGAIGMNIARAVNASNLLKSENDLDYKYLIKDVINVPRYSEILNIKKGGSENRKYWIFAPGEGAELWDEFYEDGIMALGWDKLGDLNNYKTKQDIVKKLQELENTTSSKKK
jgi:hypothetical protein